MLKIVYERRGWSALVEEFFYKNFLSWPMLNKINADGLSCTVLTNFLLKEAIFKDSIFIKNPSSRRKV